LGKLQVDRWLSCPCRSPSHRTDYRVELVSVQLRRLVKVVEGGWVFFLSRRRRADSKLFARLLHTLATKANLILLTRGSWAPSAPVRLLKTSNLGPGYGRGFFASAPHSAAPMVRFCNARRHASPVGSGVVGHLAAWQPTRHVVGSRQSVFVNAVTHPAL